jgi:hypothetical protein
MPRSSPTMRPSASTTGPPLEPGVTQTFSRILSSVTELTMPWVTAAVRSGETPTTQIQEPAVSSAALPAASAGNPASPAFSRASWVSVSKPRNSASMVFPSEVVMEIFSSRGETRAVVTI